MHAACYAVFWVCFLLQVWDQIGKFFNKETALVSEKVPDPTLTFPTLAFCPAHGFNRKVIVEELGLVENYWNYKFRKTIPDWTAPTSENELYSLWNRSTFGLTDFIHKISFYDSVNEKNFRLFLNLEKSLQNDTLGRIYSLNTEFYGQCHVLSMNEFVNTKADHIRIDPILHETYGEVKIYAFEPGLEKIAISLDYWVGKFHIFTLHLGEILSVGLTKTVQNLDPESSGCDLKVSMKDYGSCLFDNSLQIFLQRSDTSAKCKDIAPCSWPPYKLWTEELPICNTFQALKCTESAIRRSVMRAEGRKVCPSPCQVTSYIISQRSTPTNNVTTRFYSYFDDIDVVFSRQHTLYDLNTIVAAVGGSLGLFLGFSFLQCSHLILNFISEKFKF